MPELTVKALAEFATKPIADQMRILAEQKRPSAGAAQFKVHYYNPTRVALRRFFRQPNSQAVLHSAIAGVRTGGGPDHKRDHNVRALQSILAYPDLIDRQLGPRLAQTYRISSNGVDLRLHPDLEVQDGTSVKYALVNYTVEPFDADSARRTLELMFWLLDSRGVTLSPGDCEIIDLQARLIHVNNRAPRIRTISNAQTNLLAINQLWPII